MGTIQAQYDIEFRKDGTIYDDNQLARLLDGLQELTNLVVISHGWNNDTKEANVLYDGFLQSVEDVAAEELVPGIAARKLGVARLFWPSKKFVDADLIPGGGAASLAEASLASAASLDRVLDRLKHDPDRLGGDDIGEDRSINLQRAQALIPDLEKSPDARAEFVQSIRAILNPKEESPEDGSAEFFEADPETLFRNLSDEIQYQPALDEGGPASMNDGGAAGRIGDTASGLLAAARRIANFATYYEMKTRAGTVGRAGVALMLARIRERRSDLPLNLIGHSFGGRLVTAAASTLPRFSERVTMMLLQAAFSHNGLAEKFDGKHDGAFRTVLRDGRISGPLLITHTKRDRAVGIAYPLASRLARDAAAAFGDANDPYGGIGRNGAQRTPEAEFRILGDLDAQYSFDQGRVYNLKADKFISNHSDVTGHQVAYAFWNGLTAAR
jgi:pimeloyl-ACP methyl ester carboxylesterase